MTLQDGPESRTRLPLIGRVEDEDYDVDAGRWVLRGPHADETREAAMATPAKSWRRERKA
jgi:hypothetical protein